MNTQDPLFCDGVWVVSGLGLLWTRRPHTFLQGDLVSSVQGKRGPRREGLRGEAAKLARGEEALGLAISQHSLP